MHIIPTLDLLATTCLLLELKIAFRYWSISTLTSTLSYGHHGRHQFGQYDLDRCIDYFY